MMVKEGGMIQDLIDEVAELRRESEKQGRERNANTVKDFGVVRHSFSSIGDRRETSGVTAMILNNAKIDAYLKQRRM